MVELCVWWSWVGCGEAELDMVELGRMWWSCVCVGAAGRMWWSCVCGGAAGRVW